MNNAELIEALRNCGRGKCSSCKLNKIGYSTGCEDDLMFQVADALEAAGKRIVELNTKCADLQSQINSMESEIEELLPKEGGWISNYDGFDYDVRCSVCGEEALIKEGGSHDHAYSRYCPNCGARCRQ